MRRATKSMLSVLDPVLDGTKQAVEGDGFHFGNYGERGYLLVPMEGRRDLDSALRLLGMVQKYVKGRKMAAQIRITVSSGSPSPRKPTVAGRMMHFYFLTSHKFFEWARKEGRSHLRARMEWTILVRQLDA